MAQANQSVFSLLKVPTNAFTQIYYDTIIINRHLNIGLVYFSAKLLTMCKKKNTLVQNHPSMVNEGLLNFVDKHPNIRNVVFCEISLTPFLFISP